ncbi:hypothetical protein FVEG_05488 [Fusarium verticillioides 7600]|uniref:Uncharacterized protein n=1 Tax=Gibberella moniliformis (strain M3125 / FGSC 7600) TaxID=334819 RepID=W7M0E8_GIBM7|nr:hypothetical protein FVEG_05488 [Fusarium verticillioides 7600]EWG44426.1 hypothetical protein FVEG_05488 [Fusarium verticillioides 7600]
MDNLYSSAPEYMGNTLADINQQVLNGMGDDYDYDGLFNEQFSSEDFINSWDFGATQGVAPNTVKEDAQLPVDPKLESTADTHAPSDLNSMSNVPNDIGAPKPHQLQDPVPMPKTSLAQQPRTVRQPLALPVPVPANASSVHQPLALPVPVMGNAASSRVSQSVDLAANDQFSLFDTRGQTNSHIPPNYNAYNSYQPSYHYPDNGIQGIYGPQGMAQYPLQPSAAIKSQSMHKIIQVSKCANCRQDPHPGPCFSQAAPQTPPQARRPPQQRLQQEPPQAPSQEADGRPIWLQTPPKRKRNVAFDDDEDDDSDLEGPRKKPGRKGRTLKTKRGRDKDFEIGIKMYGMFRFPEMDWVSHRRFKFLYLPTGQLEKKILFSAEDLKDYVYNCPRNPRLWIQQNPAQCTERTIDADTMCRYENCPDSNNTIRPGWVRVAFDEFHQLTSCGQKDPFKMAGVMHLWCFEQCIDPVEVMANGKMMPDDRDDEHLIKEKSNKMAITRDSDTTIVKHTIRPWFKKHAGQPLQAPYANYAESLSYALVKHHLDHQVGARARSRGGRNKDRPESELKTIDVHMGRLDFWAARDTASRKKRSAKHSRAAEPEQLYIPATSNGLPPTQKSAELTPYGSTKNFSDVLESISVANNYEFDYNGVMPEVKKEEEPVKVEDSSKWSGPAPGIQRVSISISDILSPSVLLEQEDVVQPSPKAETGRKDQPISPLRRSPRLSAGNISDSVQTETKATTSPEKAQASGLAFPTAPKKVSVALPSTPEGQRAASLSDSLSESPSARPVKNKSPREGSGHAGEETQGSPLRRSSRASPKKKL